MPVDVTLQRVFDKAPGRHVVTCAIGAYSRWQWNRKGKPSPAPSVVKRDIIKGYADRYGTRILVETGTFLGGTVHAMLPHFERVFSIELSEALHSRAQRRFAGIDKVELLQGDSATKLPQLLARLHEPALFWLDGHYSAGFTAKGAKQTPVVEEVESVLSHVQKRHVLLIDDARLFNGADDYPTLPELEALVRRASNAHSMEVADDIIRVLPSSQ